MLYTSARFLGLRNPRSAQSSIILPAVKSSSEVYAETDPEIFGAPILIAGNAGDQQAALFGQAMLPTGDVEKHLRNRLFPIDEHWREGDFVKDSVIDDGRLGCRRCNGICAEGSVFIAGAAVQWLRDGLGLIADAAETAALAAAVNDNHGVYFVPAFVGLGAPYWDQDARGAIVGLTRVPGELTGTGST